jgi:hypothetical protein
VVSEDTAAFSCYPVPCATADPGTISWAGAATTTGRTYTFPFGATVGGTNYYLPFTFAVTTGSAGNISLATYHTTAQNTPWGQSVSSMGLASFSCNAGVPEVNSLLIDRGWYISAPSSPTGNITFTYAGVENTTSAACGQTSANGISAERWNGAAWTIPAGANSVATGVTAGTGTATATGINTFSPWNLIVTNTPLPVTLLDFNATCNNYAALIQWSTSSENNNKYFTIDRTQDGIHYETIDTVKGVGNSTSVHNYSVTDESPLNGISYYRLSQTDIDGSTVHLNVIPYVPCENENTTKAFVVNNTIKVELNTVQGGVYTITLYNTLGQIIYTKTTNASVGLNVYTINPILSNGLYILNVTGTNSVYTKKIVFGL